MTTPPERSGKRCRTDSLRLSIIVPVLNEEAGIVAFLNALSPHLRPGDEIVVADGGSDDKTVSLAQPLAHRIVSAPQGRAKQMNAGAEKAQGDVFVFLHADTQLSPEGLNAADLAVRRGAVWGRFDISLSGTHPAFRVIEKFISWRSRLSGIATGDQAIFIERTAFRKIEGFPDIALMEDVEFSKRLKRLHPPACLQTKVVTSSRRWETHGIVRTVVKMWFLRAAYTLGFSPEKLVDYYRHG